MSLEEGLQYFKSGDYNGAGDAFLKIIEDDKTNHNAWNALGVVYTKLGYFDQADICYQNALKIEPEIGAYERNKAKNFILSKKHIEGKENSLSTSHNAKCEKNFKNNAGIEKPSSTSISQNVQVDQDIRKYMQYVELINSSSVKGKCPICGKKLGLSSYFSFKKPCDNCIKDHKQLNEVIFNNLSSIINTLDDLTVNHQNFLRFSNLTDKFDFLLNLCEKNQNLLNFDNLEKIRYTVNNSENYQNNDFLKFFYYQFLVDYSIIYGDLPPWIGYSPPGINFVLNKNEILYFVDSVSYKEPQVKRIKYGGISHSVSIPIAKGIRYRVGTHGGEAVRVESFEEVAKGFLFITNKRLQLIPVNGNKHANIPLNKISSYVQYRDNVLEVHKYEREKPYRFVFNQETNEKLAYIILTKLTNN